jgi:hypothetical protein
MISRPPDEMAEVESALAAAEDIARDGQTERRCLACGGALAVENVGASYLVRCTKEDRVLLSSRGI